MRAADLRDLLLRAPQTGGVVQLAGGVLEAEPEQLLASGVEMLGELDIGVITQIAGAGHQASSRITNLVRTGSL